jgi:indole-3-glycerol phosphate synthase
MTILEKIVENKRYEVARSQSSLHVHRLQDEPTFHRKGNSLVSALKAEGSSQIIAEFKRKSPSKGLINAGAGVAETTVGYTEAGAAGISVLTDTVFFGGFKEDLFIAREKNPLTPLIRKDFMVDEYQVHQAKAWGADVILLIAACLEPSEIETLSGLAHELGLEVLLEVHDEEELAKSPLKSVDIVGVNNRNLKVFSEANVQTSLDLSAIIPADKVKISESCIDSPETVRLLQDVGYQGFLIGEAFMRSTRPSDLLATFIAELS